MGQDNAIYTFFIKLSFSSKGQKKTKLQKQISKILISTVMAAWYNTISILLRFTLEC